MKPIVFINSHPIQYIVPLYQRLKNQMEMQVWYCDDASVSGKIDKGFGVAVKWDIPILEGYDFRFFANEPNAILARRSAFFSIWNPSLVRELKTLPPSIVVINGWQFSTYIAALWVGKKHGHKTAFRIEAPWVNEKRKTGFVQFLKWQILRRLIVPRVDYFLYIGSQNREFFKQLGVADRQLVYTPYAVNNEYFSQQYRVLIADKIKLRKELGIPENAVVLLASGKYQPVKRPLDLLKANLQLNRTKTFIVFVGEGELRPQMEAFIAAHGLNNVMLTGFVNQSVISKYYAVSDIFVMPSDSETWGLSMNEAFNFRLPAVASNTVGSSYDLIRHGENGFIFPKGDIDALVAALNALIDNPELRQRAGALSAEIVQRFGYQESVKHLQTDLASA